MGDLLRRCSAGRTGKGMGEAGERRGKLHMVSGTVNIWPSSWHMGQEEEGKQEQVICLCTPQRFPGLEPLGFQSWGLALWIPHHH